MSRPPLAPNWQSLGGSSRQFRNVITGETLSRRQYDKRYGNLLRQGFSSYEKKAKATTAEIRQSRPAINRPSAKSSQITKLRSIRPLTEKQSRRVSIPFEVSYGPGAEGEFESEAEDYRFEYDAAVSEIQKNTSISSVALLVDLSNGQTITVRNLTFPGDLPNYGKFLSELDGLLRFKYSTASGHTTALIFHLHWPKSSVKTSKRKQQIEQTKKKKIEAARSKARRNRKKL